MTTIIAEAFKGLFSILVICALAAMAIVAMAVSAQAGPALGALIGLTGLLLIVLLFGAIALQIQNNQLLKRIADNTGSKPPASEPPRPAFTPSPTGPWPSRREPTVRNSTGQNSAS